MQNLKDSEILARLIYRAFIGPAEPGDSENMITFPMALALHARVAMLEELRNVPGSGTDADDCECLLPGIDDAQDPPDTHTHTHSRGQ